MIIRSGARVPTWRVAGDRTRLESPDLKIGGLPACDVKPSVAGAAKWRLRPREKRQLAPVSLTFSTIFSEFFREFSHHGPNWRECDPESAAFEPLLISEWRTAILKRSPFFPFQGAGQPLAPG